MKFSRKNLYAAAVPLTLGGLLATTAATQASAAVRPPVRHVATGSMALSGPLQYEQFKALQGFGRNDGYVEYTNWTYAEPGTGVYAPQAGAHQLEFTYPVGSSSKYDHTLNAGLKLTALSNDRLAFSGTGFYNGGGVTWTIKGEVKDARLTATIAYDGQAYKLTLIGQVAKDGSVSGTATAVNPAQTLAFTMPTGTFASVLHYVAPIKADKIKGHDATFQFTIPKAAPDLAGIKITVKVHDGGWGARHDRYAEGVTGTQLAPYPIIGGPGVTVR